IVLSQIPKRNVLTIAGVIRKPQSGAAERVDEVFGTPPMLDVRLSCCVGGSEIRCVYLGEEGDEIRRDFCLEPAARLHPSICLTRASARLDSFDARRECNVA